jgi:hypothetical protein
MIYVGLGFQLPSRNHHEIMVGNTYTETEGVIASVDMAKQPSPFRALFYWVYYHKLSITFQLVVP